jgi:hypothetical protein
VTDDSVVLLLVAGFGAGAVLPLSETVSVALPCADIVRLGIEATAESSVVGRCDDSVPLSVVAVVDACTEATPASAGACAGAAAAFARGVALLSGAGEPMRAAALVMPSPIALTRSAVTFAGSSGGISRAGVGSHGAMVRS